MLSIWTGVKLAIGDRIHSFQDNEILDLSMLKSYMQTTIVLMCPDN